LLSLAKPAAGLSFGISRQRNCAKRAMNYRAVRSILRPEPAPGHYRRRAVRVAPVLAVGAGLPGRVPELELPERAPALPGRVAELLGRVAELELPGRAPRPAEAVPARGPTRPAPSPQPYPPDRWRCPATPRTSAGSPNPAVRSVPTG
jgi:hypothetical protein